MPRSRFFLCALAVALSLPALEAGDVAAPPMVVVANRALTASAEQYAWLLGQLPAGDPIPRSFDHEKLVMAGARDWTVGFFPGSLWYLYEATGDPKWRETAQRYTALLQEQKNNTRTHDVGFILNCSFGNALRLTGESKYRDVLLTGAASLSTRFNATVGSIKSWDRDPKVFVYPVIIDNLMNLELLTTASRLSQDARFRQIAVTHADTTLRNHFRPDGSSVHVVDYDPATGRVLRRVTHQGARDDSAWARGQGWALYGYTMMYRETRETRYLEQAEKVARFVMNHRNLPADKVPYWDFDVAPGPDTPRDSAAAAIISSALFELATLTPNAAAAGSYTAFAEAQLRALASPAYFAAKGQNGGFLLMHATGNLPNHSEIDVPIAYADYYFLEALLRARCGRHSN